MAEPVEAPLFVVFSSIPGAQGQVTAWEDPVQVDMWARADRIRLQGRSVDGGWPGWLRPLSTAWRPLFLTGNSLERRPAISVTINGEHEEQHRLCGPCTWSHLCLSHLLHPFCGLGSCSFLTPAASSCSRPAHFAMARPTLLPAVAVLAGVYSLARRFFCQHLR